MVPQSGSTSALGHTYGVDDDVLLPVPAGRGCSRSSSESRQHDGVVAVVVEISDRASPKLCGREREEGTARVLGEEVVWGAGLGSSLMVRPTCVSSPLPLPLII